jgi:hypothetical protein
VNALVLSWRGVLRALLVAIALWLSFQTSGLSALFGDGACSEHCPTDESGGECAPNCSFCTCCSTPKTVLNRIPPASPIRHIACVTWPAAGQQPAPPDPRAILHVPKLRLA